MSKYRDLIGDAVAEALGDALLCSRDWSAWSYGTMSEDDFSPAWEDNEFVDGIVDAVMDVPVVKELVGTPRELEDLPYGVVLIDSTQVVYQNDRQDGHQDCCWLRPGTLDRYPLRYINLPATVLHTPINPSRTTKIL